MVCLLTSMPVGAEDLSGRTGLGLQTGLMKLVGGQNDFSNLDQFFDFSVRHGLDAHWSLAFALKYGWVRPGVESLGEEAGWTTMSGAGFYTVITQPRLDVLYELTPHRHLSPYFGFSLGFASWSVHDQRTQAPGLFPGGPILEGFDEDGAARELSGTNVTSTLTLGAEWFVSRSVCFQLGMRAHLLAGNQLDNVGMSAIWGPGQTDANDGLLEGFLGLTVFLSTGDMDRDGIPDRLDACPRDPEDFDGFEDTDGCPDEDNDQDGIPDTVDACPDSPEDRDGFQDTDGCPDPDNDGDGIPDAADGCPDAAEDLDGFRDQDGCPDLDDDGDGVLDADDTCPRTPAGMRVDEHGCPAAAAAPDVARDLILEGVNFRSGSAELVTTSLVVLEEVARSMLAHPEAVIEIRGHTDATGSAEANRLLSQQRAMAVRNALIRFGIAPARITANGYGEDYPIAPNDTPEGRARNRRVELHRLDR
jgi:outer membrane protein OmpA-like peptidoglycan-associated protein